MQPTFSAEQIKEMCKEADFDYDSFKIMIELIEEEIDLYNEEDLVILFEASLIMVNRSLLNLSLKFMKS
jgi:hypothetical protein